MATLDRPQLRPLSLVRFDHQGRSYALIQDPLGVFSAPVLVPLEIFLPICRHFDGCHSLEEIRGRVESETGEPLCPETLKRLVSQLDRAMVLDGPTFASYLDSYRRSPRRPAALAGRSYAANEVLLRDQLTGYFQAPNGAGMAGTRVGTGAENTARNGRLRAVLSPHIDFRRGGPVYTWAYRALAEQPGIDTFVILGVAHQYCRRRFALTLKDFETPLGLVRTDRDYVQQIVRAAGAELFDDELVHRGEHSIEFQTVFLQHVLGRKREFQVVPILVGSFHDCMERGIDPIDDPQVSALVTALKAAELASGKNVVFIGGIDLCHVGPEFGDPAPVDVVLAAAVRQFDHEMLGHAAAVEPARWFATAASVSNRFRVCGLAAAYTLLHAIGPARGELLKYDQALDDRRTCCVSFASMVFHALSAPGQHEQEIDS
jgi:AmmeMemoRadiSam system protein B